MVPRAGVGAPESAGRPRGMISAIACCGQRGAGPAQDLAEEEFFAAELGRLAGVGELLENPTHHVGHYRRHGFSHVPTYREPVVDNCWNAAPPFGPVPDAYNSVVSALSLLVIEPAVQNPVAICCTTCHRETIGSGPHLTKPLTTSTVTGLRRKSDCDASSIDGPSCC